MNRVLFPVVLYFSIYENSYSFIIFYIKKKQDTTILKESELFYYIFQCSQTPVISSG